MTAGTQTKKFTIRTANQTLPLVRRIVKDIVGLSRQINDTRERLDYLNQGRPEEAEDEYSKELQSIQLSTEEKSRQVDRFMQELLSLNTIPIASADGYVDFPAIRENEEVCLCWRQGEEEVMHWHRTDQACTARRPADLALIRQSGEMPVSNSV